MKVVTHSGNYHTDDVFAIATLLLVSPDAEIVRSRDEEQWKNADIVVDVGGEYDPTRKRFDHHQPEGAGHHINGIPYASFGLIWKEYGENLAGGPEEAEFIRTKLVLFIDAVDNGISVSQPLFNDFREYSIHALLHSFIKDEDGGQEHLYEAFMQAVDVAKGILEREIENARRIVPGILEARSILESNKGKQIIVMDKKLPWEEVFSLDPDVLYAVYPRKEGNWGTKALRKNPNTFDLRKPFPDSWAGKEGQELVNLTAVDDAVFAHRNRFLAVARSKEGAIKLAERSLNA